MSLTSSNTKAIKTLQTTEISFWWLGSGALVYAILQIIIRLGLDLRDFPGSASTLSILYASNETRGLDVAGYAFKWWTYWVGVNLEAAIWLTSVLSGLGMVLGTTLLGNAIWSRQVGAWVGVFTACWALTQQLGVLVGVDGIAIGCTWLGLGLLATALHHRSHWGILCLPLAWWLLPLGINAKSIALPSLVALSILVLPITHWKRWLLVVGSSALVASTISRTEDHRVVAPDSNWNTLEHGWHRLSDFGKRGLQEGDFQNLWILGGCCTLWMLYTTIRKRQYTSWNTLSPTLLTLFLWLATGVGLCITAAGLGELSRPRYLVGLGIGLLLPIAGLTQILPRQASRFLGGTVVLALLMNTWGFFGQWGLVRQTMLGGESPSIPTAPWIWGKKYQRYPTITLRDLTIVGALDFQDTWQTLSDNNGIATPRLRDDRHRNLQAYVSLQNRPVLLLDPGKCCAGTPVNIQCAKRVVSALNDAQYAVVLPTEIEGVERIHANEREWVNDLRQAIQENAIQSAFWHWHVSESEATTIELPCQFEVPDHMKN